MEMPGCACAWATRRRCGKARPCSRPARATSRTGSGKNTNVYLGSAELASICSKLGRIPTRGRVPSPTWACSTRRQRQGLPLPELRPHRGVQACAVGPSPPEPHAKDVRRATPRRDRLGASCVRAPKRGAARSIIPASPRAPNPARAAFCTGVSMTRVFNFSAGPAALPEPVLRQAADEMLDWHGSRHVGDGDEPSRQGVHRASTPRPRPAARAAARARRTTRCCSCRAARSARTRSCR